MSHMTENLRVTYSAPAEIDIQGFPNHPSEERFSTLDVGTSHTYELLGGLLPYQGITVHWVDTA